MILINWLVSTLVLVITAYLLPGIHIESFFTAVVLALVLGVLNILVKPLLLLLTLPITIVTLGLFTLVINAIIILLAAKIVPGFIVDGFWWAVLFSIVSSILNFFVSRV